MNIPIAVLETPLGEPSGGADLPSSLMRRLPADLAEEVAAHVKQLVAHGVSAAERQLRIAQEAGGIGTYEIDLRNGIATVTPRFLEIFGLPDDEFKVTTERWMSVIHPDDRERAAEHARRLLRSADEKNIGEYRVLGANGSRWVHSCDRVERDAAGQAVRAYGAVQDVTARKRAEADVWHAAHHDPLTGLPTRVLFHERLEGMIAQARRDQTMVGLVLLDLDRLKQANDNHGHGVGDALLSHAAAAFDSSARMHGGMAARLGGDEFAIVAKIRATGELADIAASALLRLAGTLRLGNVVLTPGATAGGGCFPDHADSGRRLIQAADSALCVTKRGARGSYALYSKGHLAALGLQRTARHGPPS